MDYIVGYAASVQEESIEKSLEYAINNEFKAVELNMNMPCFFPEGYNQERISNIRKIVEDHDIEITIHAPEDISLINFHERVLNSGLERLEEIIDFASEIYIKRITIHTGSTPYFTGLDQKYYIQEEDAKRASYILKRSLTRLINYAKEKNIMICVENSGYFPYQIIQETLQELIDDGKPLYLTWDIGHSYENKYNEVNFFQKNINRVKTVHLHDFCENTKKDHRIINTGSVEFEKHMKLIGKDCVYIIEVRPREYASKSYKNLIEILK